ncbi:hypothetical protein [Thalassotalea sp. PLHSN55]|uniref:hypothetical protein n=1 Tax=Thalassotalea sp. PLHSN55 TaxID=3435888 RepID=UPI003F86D894
MKACRGEFFAIVLLCCSFFSAAENVFTYKSSESGFDVRFQYEYQLLKLALEKTTAEFGPFILKPSPAMNFTRAINSLDSDQYPNFFMLASYNQSLPNGLSYIPFPAQRGIMGYRVFITSESGENTLKQIDTFDQLKRLSLVQGEGWSDVTILRENGFSVSTLSNYSSLFWFVAHNRANLFPRAISEYRDEFLRFKTHIPTLRLDQKFALHYPFPRFFYTRSKNLNGLRRIEKGLNIAWQDGSFMQLWQDFYLDMINEADLNNRIIFELENSAAPSFPRNIDQYMYKINSQ